MGGTPSAGYCSPASSHMSQRTEHVLVDMGVVTRDAGFRTRKRIEGRKKRKRIPNGACVFDECPIRLGE